MEFKLGDKVTWSSQANGRTKTKTGEVVEVLRPGDRPNRDLFPNLYADSGFGRKEISYVICVNKKHYWPRTLHLRLVPKPKIFCFTENPLSDS